MKINWKRLLSLCLSAAIMSSALIFTLPTSAEDTATDALSLKAEQLEADMAAFTETVPTVEYHSDYDVDGIKAITYSGATIDGAPTKVFAYIGYPADMEEGKKYPAVVLVHGGGGHAFSDWVQKWNDNGYIAIAMDNTGYFPNTEGKFVWGLSGSAFAEDGYANAPDNDNYGNISGDLDKQWIYHAVAQVILAKGVLEADSAVDADNIGIYGISWGSIITNTTIGFEKFAFAVSQYVASHFEISQSFTAPYAMYEGYKELWKADSRYDRVDFPVLFEQYSTDFSSSIRATSQCYEDLMAAGSIMALRTDWVHTHDWDKPIEIYRFADNITKGGNPLTTFLTQPDNSGEINCTVNVPEDADEVTARVQYITEKLTYTNGSSGWSADQYFKSSELEVNDGVITGTLPEDAVEFYVEVTTTIGENTYYTASKFLTVDKEYDLITTETADIIAGFENGENPFPVVFNNSSDIPYHYSVSSDYIGLSSAEEALNGNTSLKVNVRDGNKRTEVVYATGLNTSNNPIVKYLSSESDDAGILLRLKINNDTTTTGHKFAVHLSQSGTRQNGEAKKVTILSDGGTLYDLEGNAISSLTGSRACTIPSGFDGFIFLPFATAHADCSCEGDTVYDNYEDNPECMVDYTKNYGLAVVLGSLGGDTSWSNTEVLLDDICVVGGGESDVWNAMRECGYNIYKVAEPEKYSLPINAENLSNPLGNITAFTETYEYSTTIVKYTGDATTVTNKVSEVLNGKASLKVDFDIANATTDDAAIKRIKTGYFNVSGIEALSTEKINAAASDDYAYFKVRVQVPSDGNKYKFWCLVEQGILFAIFNNSGFAINANGTANNNVTFARNAPIILPSGFDGYLYLPVYQLSAMPNNSQFDGYGVYKNKDTTTNKHTALDLANDFKMAFAFTSDTTDLNKATFYLDDIDVVFGGKGDNNPTFTFDRELDTMPQAAQYKSGNYYIKNISRVTGDEALNGNGSVKVDIIGNENTNFYYEAATFSGLDGISADSDTAGVMFRMKLENDNTVGATNKKEHCIHLAVSQSATVLDTVYASRIMLFDKNGALIDKSQYTGTYNELYLPIGFDGYVFFPLAAEDRANRLNNSLGATVDITKSFNIELWFVNTRNWSGVDAIIDDVSYYSVSDSTQGLTNADAINAISSLGYDAKWTQQPDIYELDADFENGNFPFYSMNSWWHNGSNYVTLTNSAEILTDTDGNTSFKYSIAQSGGGNFIRADSNISAFKGIEGLDKETIAAKPESYAYLTMRIKVPETNTSGYSFNIYATQTGVANPTRLRAEYGYTADGEYVAFALSDGVTKLPAGFDGTIYMPIKKSTAFTVMTSGGRPTYGKVGVTADGVTEYGNDYMVDFSKDFGLQLYLGGSAWGNTEFTVDDLKLEKLHIADFDCDGAVDANDTVTLTKHLLGIDTEDYVCDINNDNNVNILDFIRIKRIISEE